VQVFHAVREPPLVEQLEVQPNVPGQPWLAAAHHDGRHEQVDLVHQPRRERVLREAGTAHAEVAVGGLQAADGFGVELALEPRDVAMCSTASTRSCRVAAGRRSSTNGRAAAMAATLGS
jgi:hypothetical protein